MDPGEIAEGFGREPAEGDPCRQTIDEKPRRSDGRLGRKGRFGPLGSLGLLRSRGRLRP